MADGVQVAQNEAVTTSPSVGEGGVATYKVVPFAEKPGKQDDLFGFRAAMMEKHAQEQEEKDKKDAPKKLPLALILMGIVGAGLLVVGGVALFAGGQHGGHVGIPGMTTQKPQGLSSDLGTRRLDAAGLGGRLIIRWGDSGSFEFYVDPLDESQMTGFQAVAQDPPRTLSFELRLLDAAGLPACQKEILIPMMNGTGTATDPGQALQARSSPSGDTIQNMADRDGQVTEIDASGLLPSCPMDAYKRITSWDFTSNFPDLDEQQAWLKHEDKVTGKKSAQSSSGMYGVYSLVRSLPAPIEGDDVIVSDNPGKGILATGGGRAFLVGVNVLTNRALDWQSFPASVHFRCEKTATCVVTRMNSRTAVRAKLLR